MVVLLPFRKGLDGLGVRGLDVPVLMDRRPFYGPLGIGAAGPVGERAFGLFFCLFMRHRNRSFG
jgi:hypothetical protein